MCIAMTPMKVAKLIKPFLATPTLQSPPKSGQRRSTRVGGSHLALHGGSEHYSTFHQCFAQVSLTVDPFHSHAHFLNEAPVACQRVPAAVVSLFGIFCIFLFIFLKFQMH